MTSRNYCPECFSALEKFGIEHPASDWNFPGFTRDTISNSMKVAHRLYGSHVAEALKTHDPNCHFGHHGHKSGKKQGASRARAKSQGARKRGKKKKSRARSVGARRSFRGDDDEVRLSPMIAQFHRLEAMSRAAHSGLRTLDRVNEIERSLVASAHDHGPRAVRSPSRKSQTSGDGRRSSAGRPHYFEDVLGGLRSEDNDPYRSDHGSRSGAASPARSARQALFGLASRDRSPAPERGSALAALANRRAIATSPYSTGRTGRSGDRDVDSSRLNQSGLSSRAHDHRGESSAASSLGSDNLRGRQTTLDTWLTSVKDDQAGNRSGAAVFEALADDKVDTAMRSELASRMEPEDIARSPVRATGAETLFGGAASGSGSSGRDAPQSRLTPAERDLAERIATHNESVSPSAAGGQDESRASATANANTMTDSSVPVDIGVQAENDDALTNDRPTDAASAKQPAEENGQGDADARTPPQQDHARTHPLTSPQGTALLASLQSVSERLARIEHAVQYPSRAASAGRVPRESDYPHTYHRQPYPNDHERLRAADPNHPHHFHRVGGGEGDHQPAVGDRIAENRHKLEHLQDSLKDSKFGTPVLADTPGEDDARVVLSGSPRSSLKELREAVLGDDTIAGYEKELEAMEQEAERASQSRPSTTDPLQSIQPISVTAMDKHNSSPSNRRRPVSQAVADALDLSAPASSDVGRTPQSTSASRPKQPRSASSSRGTPSGARAPVPEEPLSGKAQRPTRQAVRPRPKIDSQTRAQARAIIERGSTWTYTDRHANCFSHEVRGSSNTKVHYGPYTDDDDVDEYSRNAIREATEIRLRKQRRDAAARRSSARKARVNARHPITPLESREAIQTWLDAHRPDDPVTHSQELNSSLAVGIIEKCVAFLLSKHRVGDSWPSLRHLYIQVPCDENKRLLEHRIEVVQVYVEYDTGRTVHVGQVDCQYSHDGRLQFPEIDMTYWCADPPPAAPFVAVNAKWYLRLRLAHSSSLLARVYKALSQWP